MDYINIFIKSIFVDNMIFAFFLGMCSYLAVSKTVKTSAGLGIAVTFVLLITVPINYLLNKFFLAPGALAWISPSLAEVDLSFLSLIMFIAVIAAIVQMVEMVVEKLGLYNIGYENNGLMIMPPMALILVGLIIWWHRSKNNDLVEQ